MTAHATVSRARLTTTSAGLLRRALQALPEGRAIAEDVWIRRHRAMVVLVWLHALSIGVYSLLTGRTILHSLFEAGIVAVCGVGAMWGPNNRRFRSVAATLGLVSSSAILVHLSGGLVEMHFHFFVSLAVVSLYHDWAPFLVAIAFVALQHGVVGALDPHAVYNHADGQAHPWKWAGIHAMFVLAASAVSLVRWKSSEVEALKDPLTGLPNRGLFGDRLRQALARRNVTGLPLAVMFLDLDEFKGINDTNGHAAGDRLLVVVADRLRSVVRESDTVARLGGDEFAIVLEEMDEEGAVEVARRIHQAVRLPLSLEGRERSVSVSIGIAPAATGAEAESDLLRSADIAMYVAKRCGKGQHAVFRPEMHREVLERNELARDIEGAVGRNEIRVLYQPVVRLADRGIVGFEALVRWQHPRLGLFGPSKFIPLSEDTGDIVSIGRWVLREACARARAWEHEFPSAVRSMSVNVSVRQLNDPGFVGDVEAALHDSGLSPQSLILEITESAMVGNGPGIVQVLHRLKSLGVRIALDDFGTGYSSLGYLGRLPIDILKIDKTFVDGTDQGPEDAALARAILKIAESMGLECIAEGVEREGQRNVLLAAGCASAQGYLFAKPMDEHRVGALLMLDPKPALPRGTILVADSDEGARLGIARRLREGGFATVEVATGADAVNILDRKVIDLVILDTNLPEAVRVIERTRAAKPTVPMMFVSAAHARAAGMARDGMVIMKPLQRDELLSSVRRIVHPSAVAGRTA